MEAWIIITVVAAFLQNLRNSLQKSINTVLSTTGAAYTRFAYGLPLAIIYWIVVDFFSEDRLNWHWLFWVYAFVGGIAYGYDFPAELLMKNTTMASNIYKSAHENDIKLLVN